MATAAFLLLFALLFLALGAVILADPDSVPDSMMVSPNAIESDPESAAAKARRWNQIRGFVVAVVGLVFLVAGIVTLL